MMTYALPGRQLASQSGSAMVQNPTIPRSKFLNRWTIKKTFDVGPLYPLFVDEVLPGDHLKYNATAYVRCATMLFPNFDNLQIDTFWFFVPMRLVWANTERFFGEQANPSDSINYTIPQIVSPVAGFAAHSVYDHMGLPTALTAGQTISVNVLPLRAYNLIWNDWFRDENLINSVPVATTDGPDLTSAYGLWNRAKAHDYFTACLPWPQKFTAPTVPLTGSAPVTGIGFQTRNMANVGVNFIETGGATVNYPFSTYTTVATTVGVRGTAAAGAVPEVYANLSATGAGLLLNNLRQAWLIQTLLERDARGGTRYVEKIYHQFGVKSPDARLQRPEYIGGGSTPLVITPVAQTATGGSVGVGALGAAGTATGQHVAEYAATEHGYVIGIVNVRSELSYAQGLRKMWSRSTQYDFYIPALAGLGEQAVLLQELYCTGTDASDTTVFGYQERWHEYRTLTSECHGLFRPQAVGTIAPWTLTQNFTSAPTLGQTFIEENNDQMTRAVVGGALFDNQQFLGTFMIQREAVRPIPMYGTPVTLGRF